MQKLVQIALVVRDYEEAIDFYVRKLRFELIEDTPQSETKRWVVIAPPSDSGCRILLAKAKNEQELQSVGNQTGGRVFLFLHTDSFEQDYQNLLEQNITIIRPRSEELFGIVAVFADLYGNLWDLIQPI
jgi:uncharacterized glyoxalase superfamily protein PhnB